METIKESLEKIDLLRNLGGLKSVANLKIPPLHRIPEPNDVVRKWMILSHSCDDDSDLEKAKKSIRKEHPTYRSDLKEYHKKFDKARDHNLTWGSHAIAYDQVKIEGEGIEPIEKIEVKELDGKKHGSVKWMTVVGIEIYETEKGEEKKRLIYSPLEGIERIKKLREIALKEIEGERKEPDFKSRAAGERTEDKGYPDNWDDIGSGENIPTEIEDF